MSERSTANIYFHLKESCASRSGEFCCCLVLSGQEICSYGSKWLQILFLQVPHFLPYKGGNPPLVIVRAADGHTSRWVLWATSNFYEERNGSSHTPWREIILKQSKPISVGEVPYNMLAIFLHFFSCFFIIFFSLKSIDHHKNPGNATKEKTNVQRRSKNPELRRRRHWTAGCSRGGGRGSLHGAAGHGKHRRKVRPPGRAKWLC